MPMSNSPRTTLTIRPEQLGVLWPETTWPLERFAQCLREELPDATRQLDEPRLTATISAALRRGLALELRREWDLYRLCRYRLLLGAEFEDDPRYQVLARELNGPHPNKMDRVDYIYYRASHRCRPVSER